VTEQAPLLPLIHQNLEHNGSTYYPHRHSHNRRPTCCVVACGVCCGVRFAANNPRVADVEVVELNWGDRNEQLEAVGSSHRLLTRTFREVVS
jgi:hypothetical protein